MSHRIQSLNIKNYRSIKELDIELQNFTPVVGQNNVGKSNILNAIHWFIKPTKLETGDFNNLEHAVEVTGVITGVSENILAALSDTQRTKIEPYVSNGDITFKRVMGAPGAASQAKPQILNPETGDYDNNPTGISAALDGLFPEPLRVAAMSDASEDAAKNKTSTTLGKLIAKVADSIEIAEGTQLAQLFTDLGKILDPEGEHRPAEFNSFDTDANAVISEFFPGVSLKVNFPKPALSDLLKSGTVSIIEDGLPGKRKFEDMGHGAQRSIQMALLKLLAEKTSQAGNPNRCSLLLIDEPELYLHPQAIETIRIALKSLADSGYQIIFNTHSPFLIENEDMPYCNVVTKVSPVEGTKVCQRAADAVNTIIPNDNPEKHRILFELKNASQILFSNSVILVEGNTERVLMPHLYQTFTGRSMIQDKVGLVCMDSCGSMHTAIEVLSMMGIKAKAVVDLDYAYKGGVRAGLIDDDDADRQVGITWFSANETAQNITVCEEGLPKKGTDGGAEGGYHRMSQDAANANAIANLHGKLKEKGFFCWKIGSIERVLGLAQKNSSLEFKNFVDGVKQHGENHLAEKDEFRAFIDWNQA